MSMTSLGGSRGYGPTGAGQQKKVAGYNIGSLSTLSPEQMELFSRLMGGSIGGIEAGLGNLSRLAAGDESYFEQLEKPALRQFGELQGQIASRFSGGGGGAGAMGARRGSAFNLSQSSAAQQFAEQLQSQRMGLQQQAIRDLLGMGQSLLGRQTQENFFLPKQKPFWQEMLMGLAGGAGQLGGAFGARALGF